jgi:ankyrin repeat protein
VLLDAGVDVNAKDDQGSTALMQATSGNRIELLQMLLAAGAKVDAKNSEGWTALVYAACSPKSEALKVLIAAGAKTEVKDVEGKTPLMWAAFSGSIESVKELLSAKVNVNDVDKDGKSALGYAREAKEQSAEIVALLIGAGALDMPALNRQPLSKCTAWTRRPVTKPRVSGGTNAESINFLRHDLFPICTFGQTILLKQF